MAELKTKKTGARVASFIKGIADASRREDCATVLEIMKKATGAEPRMWGTSIVGLGDYSYKSAGGRENEWFLLGFSPRKQALTLYVLAGFAEQQALLKKLGKHKTGGSCLYIKRLADVDLKVLERLIQASAKQRLAARG